MTCSIFIGINLLLQLSLSLSLSLSHYVLLFIGMCSIITIVYLHALMCIVYLFVVF